VELSDKDKEWVRITSLKIASECAKRALKYHGLNSGIAEIQMADALHAAIKEAL
jgi:hypothetical protein